MAIGDKIGSMISSLGHLLNSGGGGAPTSASPGQMASLLNVSASPSPATTAGLANIGASMSPEWKAVMELIKQQKTNPWMTAVGGLGDLGDTLLKAKLERQIVPAAHPASPNTQQPGPLQFAGSQGPMSPLSTAALIEQLL